MSTNYPTGQGIALFGFHFRYVCIWKEILEDNFPYLYLYIYFFYSINLRVSLLINMFLNQISSSKQIKKEI